MNLEPMAFWKKVGIAQPGMFTVILCPASCLEASRMLRAINISLQVLMDQGKKMYVCNHSRPDVAGPEMERERFAEPNI